MIDRRAGCRVRRDTLDVWLDENRPNPWSTRPTGWSTQGCVKPYEAICWSVSIYSITSFVECTMEQNLFRLGEHLDNRNVITIGVESTKEVPPITAAEESPQEKVKSSPIGGRNSQPSMFQTSTPRMCEWMMFVRLEAMPQLGGHESFMLSPTQLAGSSPRPL